MTNVGIVKSVKGNMAKVFVGAGAETTRGIETEAFNLVHAKVGQKVRINVQALTFLKRALVLYVLPIAALLTGAVLGRAYLPAYFRGTSPDVLSATGGFFLFLSSLLTANFFPGK